MTIETQPNDTQHTQLARAIQALQKTRQKLAAVEAARHEPIAIIGMGCHYPGDAETPARFWQNLVAGVDAIIDLPAVRAADLPGHSARPGGFLAQVDQFDPAFFGLAPREVIVMDPTHRLLLETTWQALEDANIVPADLFNTEMGVFIGGGMSGYINLCLDQNSDLYTATGNVASAAAGRLSYLLGITGPCISVDTACSSSLTAIHLACQSLRNGECNAALAGGVNLLLDEDWTTMFANGNMLSDDARCKTFDAAANGYVRGEGCGMIVLKRLSDALADGDSIVAVIRGTAVNQDGPSGGLTIPNGPSQERVIRRALDDAHLKPEQISYIEAHGTGTPLGDPIEIGAISTVFQGRPIPLYVGSVKTNIGHLEMAAGVAGVMKLALSLQHGVIPAHLHLQTPNPHINWDSSPVQVPTAMIPWPELTTGDIHIGGVSSFGFSGTNAHVILAAAPVVAPASNAVERPAQLFTLSAKTEPALRAYAQRYLEFLAIHPDLDLGDLCYTSHIGRSHYAHRLSLAAASSAILQQQLADYLAKQEAVGLSQGALSPRQSTPKIAFLFTGQGAQYVDMGRELYATSPTFRATLDRCDALLREQLGESLLAVLYPEIGDTRHETRDRERIDDTTYTQPALFVLEVALATLWQSWGIQPDILIGHSIGEVAAACVAGVFSLEDGLKLVAARGRLMGALPRDGEMVSLLADEDRVRKAIEPYANEVSIAAVNGPASIVIAGKRKAVLTIAEQFAAEGVKTRKLIVSHAFHSPLMEPMLDDFATIAQSITYHSPRIPIISNITGKLSTDPLSTDPLSTDPLSTDPLSTDPLATDPLAHWQYWVRHVREAVRFGDGVQTLQEQKATIFLEIGPKPTLLGMADQSTATTFLPSLREGQSDWQQLLESLGALYVQGVKIDWQGFDRDYHRRKIVLPTYPFQRQRYWIETKASNAGDAAGQDGFVRWLANNNIEQLTEWVREKGHFAADDRATVTRVLTTLNAESRAQQLTTQVAAMLYDVAWERQSKVLTPVPPTTPGRWLLVADTQGIGAALTAQLTALGETVKVVSLSADLPTAVTRLVSADTEQPWRGVIYLRGIETVNPTERAALMKQQEEILGNLLHLTQALVTQTQNDGCLWVVTQGAQQLAALETVAVTQTPLWGLGRVIELEHSELWGGLIDLDPTTEPEAAAQSLLAEVLQPQSDGETQVAYRKGTRHVARLVQGKVKQSAQPPVIRADAAYLITGGLGALGLIVAQWLAEQDAKQLILTGRRGITNEAQQAAVNALEANGVTVQIAQIDVADETAMYDLFAQLKAGEHPLKGIFHTAGVLDDGILLNQSWDRFARVLSAKVAGSWLLHELTRDLDLDHLVFFSSVASLLGNLGQGNYAAANAFMDGLARYRRQQGLPALSINWGAWAEAGMAARTSQVKLESDQLITAETGMAALAQLLTQGESGRAQIGVAPLDWSQFRTVGNPSPFLRNFVTAEATTAVKPTLVTELAALPTNRRLDHLRSYLQGSVGRVLGMADAPDPTTGFADLGMDSLMALELRRRLERELAQALPTTLAFEYPTVDALATYLLTDVLTLAAAPTDAREATPQRLTTGMDEPIAVISIACRFPGADTPEAFWRLLCDGIDAVCEIPSARWNLAAYYDPQRPTPGKMYMREAAFVDRVDQFDPLFFGIAPREATGMDPMHRLLLETSWEALERAGLAQQDLVDSQTGVFVGIGQGEYGSFHGLQDLAELDTHAATSGGHSVAAGRLAYTLGLQGPTMAVDTACSSSLVSLHLACQSLRAGECDLALAGGVSLMLSPVGHVALSQMNALSPDGRCKTFDAAADGYGRGEGGGMVLLKRFSDAEADGDTILAVIKGSAVNHDGPSSGLTVPNKRAQEKLLRQALANAKVEPDEVAYIEAHGTGTPLGDPIELRALGAVFGAARETPLLVGSVKTNVGHLEAAAGIVGFVKTVLSLHHGQIPPHLHFQQPNPYIEWDEFAIDVPTTLQPWPAPAEGHTRVAGVSSFGISGTNAHVIVAAVPSGDKETGACPEPVEGRQGLALSLSKGDKETGRGAQLLPIAAKSDAALREYAGRYRDWLSNQPAVDLADLGYSAAVGRNHFSQRLGIVAQDRAELLALLNAAAQGEERAGVVQGSVSQDRPRIAFLFTGQGSQYINMGRELYETRSTFRSTLDRCEEIFQQETGESLLAVLYPVDSGTVSSSQSPVSTPLDDTTYTQPALFALEVALATLWQSWGIQPDILIGHSIGEVAAACVAGVFSLEDGLKLVAARGWLMGALPQDGEMVSLLVSEDRVRRAIEPYQDEVSIAAVNGPESIVIAGKREVVLAIADELSAEGVKTRKLAVSHAFHSPLMEPMLDDFARVAQNITYHQPKIPVVSNITGKLSTDSLSTDSLTHWQYWVRHVREAVRFGDGVTTLHEQGIDIFLEIGPKPTLLGIAGEAKANCQEPTAVSYLPSLRQGQSDRQQLLTSLGRLFTYGVEIDWQALYNEEHRHKVLLPTYPFQRERFWLEKTGRPKALHSLRPLIDKKTRLVQQRLTIFEKAFSTETLPFLADHHVYDEIVVPGACHLAVALSGADLLFAGAPCLVEDVIFPRALALFNEEMRTVQMVVEAGEEPGASSSFQILSFVEADKEGEPLIHATGRIVATDSVPPVVSLAEYQSACTDAVDPAAVYDNIAAAQVSLGPTFRWFASITIGSGEALAQMQIPDALPSVQGYALFPSLIDASFQLVGAALLSKEDGGSQYETQLPFAVETLTYYGPTDHRDLWCHVQRTDDKKWNIVLFTTTGQVVAEMCGFQMRTVPAVAIHGNHLRTDWLYTLAWEPLPLMQAKASQQAPDCWVLVGTNTVSTTFAAALAATGKPTFLVDPGSSLALQPSSDADGIRHATVELTAAVLVKQLLSETVTQDDKVGIVYLCGLDEPVAESGVAAQSLHLCTGLLHVTQALLELNLRGRLWVVTAGCHPQSASQLLMDERIQLVPALPQAVAAGPLWGLGRSIGQEHPSLHCTCIDLSKGDIVQYANQLQQELMSDVTDDQREYQIRYVGTERQVARLVRNQSPVATVQSQLTLSSERNYLITGGLGALGLEVAEQLIAAGAQHLILSGRRTSQSAETETRLQGWIDQGIDIQIIQADVSRQADVERLLAACTDDLPLGGIIHAAGVLDDGLVQNQTMSRFAQVMAPKVAGAWLLHTLTQALDLEFFVCFSSVAALLGSPGQSNYAAANAFMDTLMQYRRQLGLPGMSINWGAWGEVGMAVHGEAQRRLPQIQMMDPMPPQQACALLRYLLSQTVAQIGVFALNFSALAQQDQWQLPLFASLHAQYEESHSRAEPAVNLYAHLERLPPKARHEQLTHVIRTEVAQTLGVAKPEQITLQQPLFELGIDSLMALELKNKLERKLNSTLHSTLLFDYPIIDNLVSYLLDYLFGTPEQADSVQIQQNALSEALIERTVTITALSDEEAEALLLEKLNNL